MGEAALAIAREAAAPGKHPIGSVIVLNGRAIGEACNEVDLRHDATAHAEILAMRRGGQRLKCNELRDAVLYTTAGGGPDHSRPAVRLQFGQQQILMPRGAAQLDEGVVGRVIA
jgi:hypothetical protein